MGWDCLHSTMPTPPASFHAHGWDSGEGGCTFCLPTTWKEGDTCMTSTTILPFYHHFHDGWEEGFSLPLEERGGGLHLLGEPAGPGMHACLRGEVMHMPNSNSAKPGQGLWENSATCHHGMELFLCMLFTCPHLPPACHHASMRHYLYTLLLISLPLFISLMYTLITHLDSATWSRAWHLGCGTFATLPFPFLPATCWEPYLPG